MDDPDSLESFPVNESDDHPYVITEAEARELGLTDFMTDRTAD